MTRLNNAIVFTFAVAAGSCAGEARRAATGAGPLPKTIQNGEIQLAVSLDLPEGTGPFPAVVAGHGSGRVTRQQLMWLSSPWTRRGFAVLRFDKRGTGESTGTYVSVGTRDSPTVFPRLASDVVAAVRSSGRARKSIRAGSDSLAAVRPAGFSRSTRGSSAMFRSWL